MKKLVVLLLAFSSVVNAQQSYKCVVNNVTSYQAMPCAGIIEKQEIIEIKESPKIIDKTIKNGRLDIGRLEIKKGKVSFNHTYYHPKVTITNNTDEKMDVYLKYDGLDSSGFMIEDFVLTGKVDANSTKNLVDERIIDTDKLEKIVKWELHE